MTIIKLVSPSDTLYLILRDSRLVVAKGGDAETVKRRADLTIPTTTADIGAIRRDPAHYAADLSIWEDEL